MINEECEERMIDVWRFVGGGVNLDGEAGVLDSS